MATSPPELEITPEQVARYEADGYLLVEDVYSEDEMLRWKELCAKALNNGEGSTTGVHVWMVNTMPRYLLERMADATSRSLLQPLVGDNLEFLSAKAVFKNGKTSFGSPWHQDWQYWPGAPKVSVWIALDDATPDNGCLKVVPGSHKRHFTHQQVHAEQGFNNRLDERELEGLPVVTAAMKRGSVLVFSDLCVHGSHPNTSGADRWSFISTYRNASVKDSSDVWNESIIVAGESVNDNAHRL